jgi:adenylate cyclase class IV
MFGQTRIHLDDVCGLGKFVEIEVVLSPGQTTSEGIDIAHSLMRRLGISESDLIDAAYIDML